MIEYDELEDFVDFIPPGNSSPSGLPDLFYRAVGNKVSVHRVSNPRLSIAHWSFPQATSITACASARYHVTFEGLPVLLIGIEYENKPMLCVIDVASTGRLLMALHIPHKIKCISPLLLQHCDTGIAQAALQVVNSSKQPCFLATEFGHLYLVDFGLSDRHMTCTLDDPLEPAFSQSPQQGFYACVDLLNSMHSQQKFLWTDDSYNSSLQLDGMHVTSLYICPVAGLVCIGFKTGLFMFISLNTLQVNFASPLSSTELGPVVSFCMEEPENDPKSILYLWVGRDSLMQEDSIILGAELELVDLQFDGKRLQGSTVVYEDLQCSQRRFIWSPIDCNRLLNCRIIQRPTSSCLPDDSDLIRSDHDSSLCVTIWLDTKNTVQCTVFDLNAWYHAHMPSTVRCIRNKDNQCPYLANMQLNKDGNIQGNAAIAVSPTVIRFPFWKNSDCDMAFYACSYKFWCVIASMKECVHIEAPSLQQLKLDDMIRNGVGDLLSRPASICMKLKDIEIIQEVPDSDSGKWCAIANVLLHEGFMNHLMPLFAKVVPDQFGLYKTWLWTAFQDAKNCFDLNACPLFDHSEFLSEKQAASLDHYVSVIECISELHDKLTQTAVLNDDAKQEMGARKHALQLVLDYCRMIIWMVDKGLLPTTNKHLMGIKMIDKLSVQRRGNNSHLCIDGLLDGISVSGGCDPWNRNSSGSLYPPPSMLSLLSLNLLEHCQESTKRAVVYYFLLDVRSIGEGKVGFLKADLSNCPELFANEFLMPLDCSLKNCIEKEWRQDSVQQPNYVDKSNYDVNDNLWLTRIKNIQNSSDLNGFAGDKFCMLNLPLNDDKELLLREKFQNGGEEESGLYKLRLLSCMKYREALSYHSNSHKKFDDDKFITASDAVMDKIKWIIPPQIKKTTEERRDILKPQPSKTISKSSYARVSVKGSMKAHLGHLKALRQEPLSGQTYSPLKRPGPPPTPGRLTAKDMQKLTTPSQKRKSLVGKFEYIQHILNTPLSVTATTSKGLGAMSPTATPSILKTAHAHATTSHSNEHNENDVTMTKQLRFDLPESPSPDNSPVSVPPKIDQVESICPMKDENECAVIGRRDELVSASSAASSDMELASVSSKYSGSTYSAERRRPIGYATNTNASRGSTVMDISSANDYLSDESIVDESMSSASKFVTYMSGGSVQSMHTSNSNSDCVISPASDDSVFEKDTQNLQQRFSYDKRSPVESGVLTELSVVMENTQEESTVSVLDNETNSKLSTIQEDKVLEKIDKLPSAKKISPVSELVRPSLRSRSKTPEPVSTTYQLRARTPQKSPTRTRKPSLSSAQIDQSPSRRSTRGSSEVQEIAGQVDQSLRPRTRSASESKEIVCEPTPIKKSLSLYTRKPLEAQDPISSRTRSSPSRKSPARKVNSPSRKTASSPHHQIPPSPSRSITPSPSRKGTTSPSRKSTSSPSRKGTSSSSLGGSSPSRKGSSPSRKGTSPSRKGTSPSRKGGSSSIKGSISPSLGGLVSCHESDDESVILSEPPPTPVVAPRKSRLRSGRRSVSVSGQSNGKAGCKSRKSMPAISQAASGPKSIRRRMTDVNPKTDEVFDSDQMQEGDESLADLPKQKINESKVLARKSILPTVPENELIAGDDVSGFAFPTPVAERRRSRLSTGRVLVRKAIKRLSISPKKEFKNAPAKRKACEFVFSPPVQVSGEERESNLEETGSNLEENPGEVSSYPFSPPILRSRTPPRVPPNKKTRLAVRFH